MGNRYAATTTVTAEGSRAEIERTLTRYGADAFFYGWDGPKAEIGFRFNNFQFRLDMVMPDREDYNFTPTGKERYPDVAFKAWEQGCKQRWRAMAGYIKMTLEAVESGIITLETALLPHIVLPDNTTVGQWAMPELEKVYLTGGPMPKMLQSGRG